MSVVNELDQLQILDGYEAFEKKSGGMGTVYLCRRVVSKSDRQVAIKIPHERLLHDDTNLKRWLYEAHAWLKLGIHPNIIRPIRIHLVERIPQLVLEYAPGGSLRERLRTGSLDLVEALTYAIHTCNGMIHAHSVLPDFLHRDLKPENLLFGSDNLLKITDFGLISAANKEMTGRCLQTKSDSGTTDAGSFATKFGAMVGTPAYCSPEQIRADAPLDSRSDIYAFGCVLFEMLTGELLFSDQDQLFYSYPQCHLTITPRSVRNLRPDVPEAVALILGKCLEKDAARRPENFTVVRQWLNSALQDMGEKSVVTPLSTDLSEEDSGSFADAFYKLGDYETAEKMALELALDNTFRYLTLGRIYRATGQYERAVKLLEKRLREPDLDNVERSALLETLGLSYKGSGDLETSEKTIRSAVAISPKSVSLLVNLGNVLKEKGDLGGALNAYSDANNISSDRQVICGYAYLLAKTGRYNQSLDLLHSSFLLYPQDANMRHKFWQIVLMRVTSKLQSREGFNTNDVPWLDEGSRCLHEARRLGYDVKECDKSESRWTQLISFLKKQGVFEMEE